MVLCDRLVHHDNNSIFTHNDVQLKFSHSSSQKYFRELICCFDLDLSDYQNPR